MQDLGTAGQDVIGNKVPNSGTASRLMTPAAIMAAFTNPKVLASTIAAPILYSSPVQRGLVAAVTARPNGRSALRRYCCAAAAWPHPRRLNRNWITELLKGGRHGNRHDIKNLSQTAALNGPDGTVDPPASLDDSGSLSWLVHRHVEGWRGLHQSRQHYRAARVHAAATG